MPYTTQTSEFWGWYLRHNNRAIWRYLHDAGVDVFASGPNNNSQAFLQLQNVLPAVNGGFQRRWGVSLIETVSSPSATWPPIRTFAYNFPQDVSDPSNTADTNIWIGTNNQNFIAYTDVPALFTGPSVPSSFASSVGNVNAATSRGYFYYCNGIDSPKKVNPSYTTADTDSLLGIALPTAGSGYSNFPCALLGGISNLIGETVFGASSGYGYITTPTVTITDPTGGGSGASITLGLGTHGEVVSYALISGGTGYGQAEASITAPPAGGTQASLILYVQTNSGAPNFGEVVGADFGGPMAFSGGRTYTVALQNSLTGHTSDVYITDVPASITTGTFLNALTAVYSTIDTTVLTNVPVYISSTSVTAGYTQIEMVISVPANSIDPQIDTVILLAGADGQGLSTLYEVTTIPLSSFTLVSGFYQFYYVDTLPDTFTDQSNSGNTLLEADIWSETDSFGNTNGIALNTPPPQNINFFTQHQGRLFGTDGKTVFFSKSLDEVTTSTGLITSKWEEAWPGDYQLPVALQNENILGLRSDGTTLHIGTNKSMFTLYGSDPSSFSIPNQAFATTGILNNDCWTTIYNEGQPSGFAWLTQDLKVIYSDFVTYRDVGTPIYPILQLLTPSKTASNKALSLSWGPYNFVVFALFNGGGDQPELWLWETRLGKWYQWLPPFLSASNALNGFFVYQYPVASGSSSAGSVYMQFWIKQAGGADGFIARFDPAAPFDEGSTVIPWAIQTSWQDLGDSTSIKVVNEIEVIGSEAESCTVSLYGASSESQFSSGGNLLKTGTPVQAPLSTIDAFKFYCAGAPTAAKFYSILISNAGTNATDTNVLTSFVLETYPMARI
jgi:hypothetical protein